MRASYPPAARLHRPSEFAAALKDMRLARGALFVVSTPRQADAELQQHARLGMVIGKRMAPLAVSRNTIKRVIREAFRLRRHELPARDFVFRLHSRIPSGSLSQLKTQVRNEVDTLLDRS